MGGQVLGAGEGDHVVVYPAQGSHAAYFTQSQWFGKSAAAGFGCDDTTAPGVRVDPTVVVLPAGPPPTSAITRPVLAPTVPIHGEPVVRTLNASCDGKTSMYVFTGGSVLYSPATFSRVSFSFHW